MSLPITVRLVVESASPKNAPEFRHTKEKLHHTVIFRAELPAPQGTGETNLPFVLGHIRYEQGNDQEFVNGQVFETVLNFKEIKPGTQADKKE